MVRPRRLDVCFRDTTNFGRAAEMGAKPPVLASCRRAVASLSTPDLKREAANVADWIDLTVDPRNPKNRNRRDPVTPMCRGERPLTDLLGHSAFAPGTALRAPKPTLRARTAGLVAL
jgi:hypothetical protein